MLNINLKHQTYKTFASSVPYRKRFSWILKTKKINIILLHGRKITFQLFTKSFMDSVVFFIMSLWLWNLRLLTGQHIQLLSQPLSGSTGRGLQLPIKKLRKCNPHKQPQPLRLQQRGAHWSCRAGFVGLVCLGSSLPILHTLFRRRPSQTLAS